MNLSLRSAVNLVHTLIFNNHPRLILSLVDLPLRSAVNLFTCKSFSTNCDHKSTYRSSPHYPQCASHRFLPKSVPNLIFYQNPSLILDHLQAFGIDLPCSISSHVDLIQPPSTTRCSTHWWEKIEAGATQLAGL